MKTRILSIVFAVFMLLGIAPLSCFAGTDRFEPSVSGYAVGSAKTVFSNKNANDEKSVLLKKIKKKTNEKITKAFYADFDSDGKKELFAVTGTIGDFESRQEIWFSSAVQVKKIPLSSCVISAKKAKVTSKQSLFIAEQSAGGSGSSSICCFVKKGKAVQNSQQLSLLTQIKGKDFSVVDNAFDSILSDGILTGHTYKKYYLKWTGAEFAEYKGTIISKAVIKSFKNGSNVLTRIKKAGYTIDKIFKRGNGIININVHIKNEYGTIFENVNLKISGEVLKLLKINDRGENIVSKSSFGGIYKAGILKPRCAAPSITSLKSNEPKKVTVKWEKVTGAKSYIVYKSADNKKWTKAVSTTKLSATLTKLTAGKKYYIKIKAVNADGLLSASSKVKSVTVKNKGASMIKIEDNKTYHYDVNGDGEKETITAKTIQNRRDINYADQTIRYIYINGEKYLPYGYDTINLWILNNGNKNIIINQAVAGTGGTSVYYYYYNGKKYILKYLGLGGYYFETPFISNGCFKVAYAPKYNWFSSFDSLKCFDEWGFDIIQKYKISNKKLVKSTDYPSAKAEIHGYDGTTYKGYKKYVSNGDSFRTGKKLSSIFAEDGPVIKNGDIIDIQSVYLKDDSYCYKVKVGNKTGWFKGSSTMRFTKYDN